LTRGSSYHSAISCESTVTSLELGELCEVSYMRRVQSQVQRRATPRTAGVGGIELSSSMRADHPSSGHEEAIQKARTATRKFSAVPRESPLSTEMPPTTKVIAPLKKRRLATKRAGPRMGCRSGILYSISRLSPAAAEKPQGLTIAACLQGSEALESAAYSTASPTPWPGMGPGARTNPARGGRAT